MTDHFDAKLGKELAHRFGDLTDGLAAVLRRGERRIVKGGEPPPAEAGRVPRRVVAFASPPPKIFDLAVWCFSGFASLFPLVFAAIYWRRVTKAGAIASILVMLGSWLFLFYRGLIRPAMEGVELEGVYLVWGMMPVTVIFAASALALVLVSLVTSPPPAAVVERFMVPRSHPRSSS